VNTSRSRHNGAQAQLTMDQWVMGQMGQQIWVGHVGHGSVPVTYFTLYSSGIPRDFLVHVKPATAIETVVLTVS